MTYLQVQVSSSIGRIIRHISRVACILVAAADDEQEQLMADMNQFIQSCLSETYFVLTSDEELPMCIDDILSPSNG